MQLEQLPAMTLRACDRGELTVAAEIGHYVTRQVKRDIEMQIWAGAQVRVANLLCVPVDTQVRDNLGVVLCQQVRRSVVLRLPYRA